MGNESDAEKAMKRLDASNVKVEDAVAKTRRVLDALKENQKLRRIKWNATHQQLGLSSPIKKSRALKPARR
ncbi:Uncharacterised protein [uncultured archaeon]|nr:Uncharacterised protein [uncultured archaeon]